MPYTRGKPFNILYIHTHDTGRYIGPYGYPVYSPHMDAFASEATVFRNAFSVSPTCSPSRAGLLTGTYPHENGMMGLAHRGFTLDDYRCHLAPSLSHLGYTTALCGVQHVSPDKHRIGYDLILDEEEDYFLEGIEDLAAYDRANAERAARFLEHPPEEPFFLSFGMLNTHRPFPSVRANEEKKELNPYFLRPPSPIPDAPEAREDTARFYESIRDADQCIGTVLDSLSRSGLKENTLVILTTDHGPAFPEMKASLYDSGTGVFLMIKLPAGSAIKPSTGSEHKTSGDKSVTDGSYTEAGPAVIDEMVSHLDIVPTISHLLRERGVLNEENAGACSTREKAKPIRGRSLLPLLRPSDSESPLHTYIFTETTFHAAYEPTRAVRSSRYKLIRRYAARTRLPVNVDDSPVKEIFNACGYFKEPVEGEELYDLLLDPSEKHNRISDPRYRKVLEELRSVLNEQMKNTEDPLLKGKVAPPKEALINSAECYSPACDIFEQW